MLSKLFHLIFCPFIVLIVIRCSWGRILAAAGSVPPASLSTPLNTSKISVSLVPSDGSSPLPLLKAGEPVGVDEVRAKEILKNEDIEYRVELGLGKETAKYWTCDYSYVS